jgi:hypothetical protein
MTKPDDSHLDPDKLRAVEERARKLLDRASAWNRFPTPVSDLVSAAELRIAPTNAFDPDRIIAFVRDKAAGVAQFIKSAISKVLGLYDGQESIIHIDPNLIECKQNFLKLHETGHHEIGSHRKAYRLFQDCDKTLAPEIADLFEKEANNFARFTLFQGDIYSRLAADCAMSIKVPMKLARKFGASLYASAREFARTNHRACVVFVLEPIQYVQWDGARADVRRIEASPSFIEQFGQPADTVVTVDHWLGHVLPVGRKMTGPRTLSIVDRNGTKHECLAEAFDTSWNVLILVYPIRALTTSTIILPAGFKASIRQDDVSTGQ